MKNYEYEEDLDILYINNNFNKEKSIGNLIWGNIIIDIGENGKVLGLEIDCASKLFNFPCPQLKDLKVAKIQVMKVGNMLTLSVILATHIKEHTFQFAIPQETNKVAITC
ncbi:hypothetical protein COU56_02665 [Candidatus Pacearchaeota archaeon CG10_big_fil_rev_8_21_14_0_10_31_9]|nr:MAG: hypothetical protein AUJ62_03080 [Candidatus Pacearchaeota archaeon CG1_02_32_21]PIN94303.1 MAG: hypothetical protein COU56_02665 [Candidatus Pacearchaeota archaeon CG10_big_fil_rev_8_21_14_0_10_31_9]PIZ82738.1 MAG: hypothetical protein COX97_03225 [Candidatus Pacearchaeota archaeon CG_4_10_14_0_2_um_filter_05_32_18]